MNGLAMYEIIKTGFFFFILLICFCGSIGITTYNLNLNYIFTTGEITLNSDGLYQTLTYTVDNKEYSQTISPITNTYQNASKQNITTTVPAFPVGPCKLYYSKSDPNKYSINYNPTIISGIGASILCCLSFFTLLWLLFLRENKDFASVIGASSLTSSIIGNING